MLKPREICKEENKRLISPMVAENGFDVLLQNNSLLEFGNNNTY
jgi:hypothetical protein